MPQARLFLERRSYRRRRMMDAVRMLPVLCLMLWLVVPIMWPNGAEAGQQTSLASALWYIFFIWMLAIAASFGLWRRIRRFGDASDPDRTPDADAAPAAPDF